MRVRQCFVLILLGFAVSAPSRAALGDVPMVGLDEKGSPIEIFVPKKSYQNRMTNIVSELWRTTCSVLDRHAKIGPWMMRTVIVGVGGTVETGFDPVFKVGATARLRMAFSNSSDPALP